MRPVILLAVLLLAGCGAKGSLDPIVIVEPMPIAPMVPVECTIADPTFPVLPDGDISADTAARDRALAKRRYGAVLQRRAVCRAALEEITGKPSPLVSASMSKG